ncbi:MAG: GntR family transcriptional regulator [Pseudobutyrivibrio sp.]|nr:GntR family transcriptional regulator [Pseudobutyrivibrio sp.]
MQKYDSIVRDIKSKINRGKYKQGDKLPSENQLAAAYDVSRQTVRKALGQLEDEQLVYAVHGKGTFVKPRLFSPKNAKNIAVVTTYKSNYIFPRVIQGINRVLQDEGYNIIQKTTNNSRTVEGEILEELLCNDLAGLIVEPAQSAISCKHNALYQQMDVYGIPYVFIQGCFEEMMDRPHVMLDDVEGGYRITQHLINKGHKSIVGIFKIDDYQGKMRHKGYAKALQEAGLYYDPDKVIFYHNQDKVAKPRTQVLSMINDIDAVVCYNDEVASEIIRACKEEGRRVPEDIAVTGFDYSFIARSEEITTVNHPQEELGRAAAQLLLELIEKGSVSESSVTLRPVVVEGKTG